jgi:hypothetical protein
MPAGSHFDRLENKDRDDPLGSLLVRLIEGELTADQLPQPISLGALDFKRPDLMHHATFPD